MERSVPWWRRVLEFALGGMRSGWGLFRRNGTKESAAETIREVEVTEGRIDQAKNEIAVKDTSPQNEEVAADIEQAAEVRPAEESQPESQPVAASEVDPVQADAVERTDDRIAAEEQAQEDSAEQTVEVVAAKQQIDDQQVEELQAVTEAMATAEEPAAAEPDEAPEETTPAKPIEETAVIPPSESAPVPEPEPEPTAMAQANPVKEAPAQEAPTQEPAPKLPFAPKPKHERTTAEKVAAALKARGVDAEQSPFSVLVSQVYDGPLDLLLDLIRKQDIDIYDIPIAKITAQFLAYVDRLKASDMDVAGEFIYTAALLIHIKSKMLLPRAPAGPEDAAEDPRRELVERLLEHERFKNAAQMLHEKQMLEAATWTNPGVREFRETEDADIGPEIAADTTDLVRVFSNILERARNRPVLDVQEDTVTVGQMIQFLARRLTMEDKPVALRRLLTHTRSERALIAMFLALLEMVRLQAILLRQDRHFSEIFIKKHTGFEAAMNQGLANARDDWR